MLVPSPTQRRAPDPRVGPEVAHVILGGLAQDAWPERDQAMVGVIVGGSLTLARVSMLLLSDVDQRHDGWRLRSRSRQGRVTVVQLPPPAHVSLDTYLAARQARALRSVPDLFVRAGNGKPYTVDTLRALYVRWFRLAGLAVPIDPPEAALRPVYAELMGEPEPPARVAPSGAVADAVGSNRRPWR